jgi:hypothetical protein
MNFDHFLQESKIVQALEKEGLNAPELMQEPIEWSEGKTLEQMIEELGL